MNKFPFKRLLPVLFLKRLMPKMMEWRLNSGSETFVPLEKSVELEFVTRGATVANVSFAIVEELVTRAIWPVSALIVVVATVEIE